MFKLLIHTAHRALHEGHQLLLLILVEGKSMKGTWFLLFLGVLFLLISLQELWPKTAAAAAAALEE